MLMRKFSIAGALVLALIAGAAGATLAPTTAQAGLKHYTLCWTAARGGSECVHLPRHYRLPGLKKPRIPDGTVSFTLTRGRIACLRAWVNTADMLPGQGATIYAPKY